MKVSIGGIAKLRELAGCTRFCGLDLAPAEGTPVTVAHNTVSFGVAVLVDRSELDKDGSEQALTEWLQKHHQHDRTAALGIAGVRETVRG